MTKSGITAHMVVKNEDKWIWYAINSVLPYVNSFLITDTGSTDNTVNIIKNINSDKIKFSQVVVNSPHDMTLARQAQIKATMTPWIWLVDGDEIYGKNTVEEIISAAKSDKYSVITVRRYDLLGDLYHKQNENVGTYKLYGERGHLVSRLFNMNKLKNLHLKGDYPNEEYFYNSDKSTLQIDLKEVFITKSHLYHTMYLRRSSLGSNIGSMFNRSKYKIEKGELINDKLPEVFSQGDKSKILLKPRSLMYEIMASFISPIKALKRKLL